MQQDEEQQSMQNKGKQENEELMVPYSQLFRYATSLDKSLMIVGSVAAFLNGAAFPSFSIIFGQMTDSFSQKGDAMVDAAGWQAIYFVIIGAGTMLMSFIMFATWMISGERQGIQFRKSYFSALLKQEIGWFDTINPNELSNKVANESFSIQGAIGEKMPTFIMTFSMTFFGFLIGFIYGWQLALVITASLPAISIVTAIFAITIQNSELATQKSYSDAGAMAEQAINAIKTVKMLDGEDFECVKYANCLSRAASMTFKYNFGVGLTLGLIWAVMLWSYALGFWYGAKLIADQTYNPNQNGVYTAGDVMIIFFAILTGGFSLGQAGPCVQNFAKGRAAAYKMFQILDRVPKLQDPVHPKSLQDFNGEITLKNVKFSYPNRPEQIVLDGLSLTIPTGQKIALVGESGCGKSTVMQMIERFYDCDEGEVLFGGENGVNAQDLIMEELRNKIGMVGQEPVLFATSIKENLLYGNPKASEEEMIEALKKVNAWDFVSKMEKGLETYVGIGGGQLSGGQKQRIAIARAILKKPQVLLLDEATSALDRTNEKLIQETLDEVSKGITTIVIAHRLTTIQNADLIYVIDKGKVVEQGKHQELMNKHGKYEELAKSQVNVEGQQEGQQQGSKSKQILVPLQKGETGKPFEALIMNDIVSVAQKEISDFNDLEMKSLLKKKDLTKSNAVHPVADLENGKEVDSKKVEKAPDAQMGRLFGYNKQEMPQFIIGIISAMANGCVFPVFSLFLSEMITLLVLQNPKLYENDTQAVQDSQKEKVRNDANDLALKFFYMGLASFILWLVQSISLAYVGEQLTLKLRIDTYRKLLRMPIPYFDEPKNNAGTLTSRLSVDCKTINGLTSNIIGINLSNIGALICGITISFTSSWALTLIMFGITPLMFIGGALQAQFLQGFSALTDEAYKDSSNLIMEAVTNIRTVYSFGNESIILGIYDKKVQQPLEQAEKRGIYAGLAFGVSQMQAFLVNALVFYLGAILVRDTDLKIGDMFKSIFSLTFAVMGAGNNAAFAGDIGAAKNASKNIFEILDSEDEFQKEERLKKQRLTTPIQGNIQFKDISFKYATREKQVFSNLNLKIDQGQKVGFVGPSGCGKSTLMQMLMRFYEPDTGMIYLDGIDILDFDIRYLRRHFGIVSQEPVLFMGTIKENIIYNLDCITQDQIEDAAKQANAYDFIMKNQFETNQLDSNDTQNGQAFDRQVGAKGSQISGGQKQRIAIARAILRDSNILLLDEATSALDTATEQLVQESLGRLMANKTTIAIAHRISTIKDSDMIYVFEDGKIVEQGNYNQLSTSKGVFYRLEHGIIN